MYEDLPSEEVIASNLVSFSGDLYNASDIKRFLEIPTFDKPNSIRFIAWCAALRIIDGDRIKWMPDIIRALNYYDRCVKRYFKTEYNNPLRNLMNGPDIRVSVEKNMEWFKKMAIFEAVNEKDIQDAETRIQRILSVLSLDNSKYKFTPSDERIVMVLYICALGFARRGTLTTYFAEAFTYHMSNVIISALNFQREIMRINADEDYRSDFMKYMKRFASQALDNCKSAGVDPIHIYDQMVWTMFTECHENCDSLLLIFDLIILNLKEYRHYTNYLVASHFKYYLETGGRLESHNIVPDAPFDGVNIIISVDIMKEYKEINYVEYFMNAMCPCFAGFNILFGNGSRFHRKYD